MRLDGLAEVVSKVVEEMVLRWNEGKEKEACKIIDSSFAFICEEGTKARPPASHACQDTSTARLERAPNPASKHLTNVDHI